MIRWLKRLFFYGKVDVCDDFNFDTSDEDDLPLDISRGAKRIDRILARANQRRTRFNEPKLVSLWRWMLSKFQ